MKTVFKREITRYYYKMDVVEYPEGLVKFESSTPGTYSVELTDGIYEITCVAGGSGGTGLNQTIKLGKQTIYMGQAMGGGSGSGFSGTFTLTEGTYSITVGAGSGGAYNASIGAGGSSSVSGVVTCYGGGSHATNGVGAGGAAPTVSLEATNITLNTAGNAGGSATSTSRNCTAAGGASVYGGYGAGGSATSATAASGSGGPGYVKILAFQEIAVVPGTAEDYDFYEDVINDSQNVCQLENNSLKAFKEY